MGGQQGECPEGDDPGGVEREEPVGDLVRDDVLVRLATVLFGHSGCRRDGLGEAARLRPLQVPGEPRVEPGDYPVRGAGNAV